MAIPTFSDYEKTLLMQVLELNPSRTRKNTPALKPLSFYSSELKAVKQIVALLDSVQSSKELHENAVSRARYFNTLSNQGLVTGSALSPELSDSARAVLALKPSVTDDSFWRDHGPQAELLIIRPLAQRLSEGEHVSEAFKQVWFSVQAFVEQIPKEELGKVLSDPDQALFLFHIYSAGWEPARFYRLDKARRDEFKGVFAKVPLTSEWAPSSPIETAASQYKDAASQIQIDVRYRINGFLNAYVTLREEMKENFPRLDRELVVRSKTTTVSAPSQLVSGPALQLPLPHQLIVSGCPGSGKSHFIDDAVSNNSVKTIRTQFHTETSFFDFVGAYKPHPIYETYESSGAELVEADGTLVTSGKPIIDYRFVPGPFIQAIETALLNPGENIAVVIEEINRGNAAAIFGDFLQLLDRAADGSSRYAIHARPELKAYFARSGIELTEIRLPRNLYLWATMNNADQGVFPLDTAFRRRWNFKYKGYSEPCRYPSELSKIIYGGRHHNWDDFRALINAKLIEIGVHEDKLIGPYFLTSGQLASAGDVAEKLWLYLWDDVLRLRQELLFIPKSFSGVVEAWNDGKGAPLHLDVSGSLITGAVSAAGLPSGETGEVSVNFEEAAP